MSCLGAHGVEEYLTGKIARSRTHKNIESYMNVRTDFCEPIAVVFQREDQSNLAWGEVHWACSGLTDGGLGEVVPMLELLVERLVGVDVLVTYNGTSYDLPVIIKSCIRHGIALPKWLKFPKRYGDSWHVDMMNVLSGYDLSKALTLDVAGAIYGIAPSKIDVHGSDVYELWKDNQTYQIREHCEEDVRIVKELFELFMPAIVGDNGGASTSGAGIKAKEVDL